MAGKRVTKAEIEQRVGDVYEWLILGLTRREILQYIAKSKNWHTNARQIDNYIAEATRRIEEAGAVDRMAEIGKARARLEKLYQNNLKIQDYKAALAVQKEIITLFGLAMPVRTMQFIIPWERLTPEQIDRLAAGEDPTKVLEATL